MDTTVFWIVTPKNDCCIEINRKYCGIFGMFSGLVKNQSIVVQIVSVSGLRLFG